MMNAVTVKVNEDPSKLFEQVSAIQNRYDTVTHMIDEEELIAVAVGTAPKAYISFITMEYRTKGKLMKTLKDLEAIMY
jgi:hypothetical protein